jgi:hypothetical protein
MGCFFMVGEFALVFVTVLSRGLFSSMERGPGISLNAVLPRTNIPHGAMLLKCDISTGATQPKRRHLLQCYATVLPGAVLFARCTLMEGFVGFFDFATLLFGWRWVLCWVQCSDNRNFVNNNGDSTEHMGAWAKGYVSPADSDSTPYKCSDYAPTNQMFGTCDGALVEQELLDEKGSASNMIGK